MERNGNIAPIKNLIMTILLVQDEYRALSHRRKTVNHSYKYHLIFDFINFAPPRCFANYRSNQGIHLWILD